MVAKSLDMTLDEIVKMSKTARSGGKRIPRRGRDHGPNGFLGAGPVRRGPLAVHSRPSNFSNNKIVRRKKKSLPWQNDLVEESLRAVGISGVEPGTTVSVTNLNQGVTNEDIRELFAEIGELKRYAIHYGSNGCPSGSAEVVYLRRSDAFQAIKRYNNVLLDGRAMKVEILGGNTKAAAPVSARLSVPGLNGRMRKTASIGQRVKGGRGRWKGRSTAPFGSQKAQNKGGNGRGGKGGFRGKGGRGVKKPVEISAAELDKDLESYHAEAMLIS